MKFRRFKGTVNQYMALHHWVNYHLGKPKFCSNCGSEDKNVYHWANISGDYKRDLTDWKRLCVSCHRFLDSYKNTITECKNGHEYTQLNTYVSPRGYRQCIICREESRKLYRNKIGVLT